MLVGGQPAAGKTAAIARLHDQYGPRDPVAITGDDLRVYHPDYLESLAHDPLEMPNITAPSSGRWVRDSISYACAQRISVIIEGTFRDPVTTIETAERFAESGFTTHLVALAVPGAVSRLDAVHRYFGAVAAGEPGRWSPLVNQDAGYLGVPATVERAERSLAVDRITVTDRAGAIWYDNSRGPHGSWADPPEAGPAVQRARGDPLSAEHAREWLDRFEQNLAWARDAGQLDHTTLPNFRRLAEYDAPGVVEQAYPGIDNPTSHDAAHQLESVRRELEGRDRDVGQRQEPIDGVGREPRAREQAPELGDDGFGLG